MKTVFKDMVEALYTSVIVGIGLTAGAILVIKVLDVASHAF